MTAAGSSFGVSTGGAAIGVKAWREDELRKCPKCASMCIAAITVENEKVLLDLIAPVFHVVRNESGHPWSKQAHPQRIAVRHAAVCKGGQAP